MARIVLGKRPETVSLNVPVLLLDGSKTAIKVDYKYRTRAEYAEFVKNFGERHGEGDASPVLVDQQPRTVVDWFEKLDAGQADFIMEIASAWDLSDEFTRENVLRLIDEFPAAATGIVDAYRLACIEGRRGN